MRTLFITRKYPPQIGGMEKFSAEFYSHLRKSKSIIALNKNQLHLAWFLPFAFLKALATKNSYDHIHVGDGVLGLLAYALKTATKKPVTITIHGLDITYKNPLHQLFNVQSIAKLDAVVAVSNNTYKECLKRNISKNKISIIQNGIAEKTHQLSKDAAAKITRKKLQLTKSPILLTTGRLIKRKGHFWFITEVLPRLSAKFNYIIIGSGPEIENIRTAAKACTNVHILQGISNKNLKLFYRAADLFIMPNIPDPKSIEGFGIVLLEAGIQETPTIATNIDGISDALSKEMGMKSPHNPDQFATITEELLLNTANRKRIGKSAKTYVEKTYAWEKIIQKYHTLFDTLS